MQRAQHHICHLIILLVGLASIGAFSTPAAAQRYCAFEKPKFTTRLAMTKTRYIRTKSSRELTDLAGHINSQVGGLGGGEIGFKLDTKFEVREEGGRYCVGLTHAKVIFYGKPEVHIASNFKKGTCEYTAVLGHEQRHIRTMKQFISEKAPDFAHEVKRIARSTRYKIGPIAENQVENAQMDLQEDIIRQVEIYLNSIMPTLATRQAKHDTPKEYAKVFDKCKRWDEKFNSNP
ncbi:MAG: hypothetical protein KTR28_00180 [Micavibrio sp.]|nr:hypothetical protein [Micavibrio sp.]